MEDGWIEWGGGKCPIDEKGGNIDLKFDDGYNLFGIAPFGWTWRHKGVRKGDRIIAYRPAKMGGE